MVYYHLFLQNGQNHSISASVSPFYLNISSGQIYYKDQKGNLYYVNNNNISPSVDLTNKLCLFYPQTISDSDLNKNKKNIQKIYFNFTQLNIGNISCNMCTTDKDYYYCNIDGLCYKHGTQNKPCSKSMNCITSPSYNVGCSYTVCNSSQPTFNS